MLISSAPVPEGRYAILLGNCCPDRWNFGSSKPDKTASPVSTKTRGNANGRRLVLRYDSGRVDPHFGEAPRSIIGYEHQQPT